MPINFSGTRTPARVAASCATTSTSRPASGHSRKWTTPYGRRRGGSAPAVGGVAVGAEQQGHVMMLRGVADAEEHRHAWIEPLDVDRLEEIGRASCRERV